MMKTVKFKNLKLRFRNKVILSVCLTALLVYFMFNKISNYITFNMKDYIVGRVKKENLILLKEAFEANATADIEPERLIKVIKNSKEEIVEVEFQLTECQRLLSNITEYINVDLESENFTGYRLDIPLGYISNNPLLMNLGPKLPIKIEIADVALGNVSTKVESFGINSALVKVFLEIYLKTSILYPFETIEETSTFYSLLSSKIISGTVPDFYNGSITTKSEEIKLPISNQ